MPKSYLAAQKNAKKNEEAYQHRVRPQKSGSKKGTGKIELCIYLKAGERRYETVAEATPEEWEFIAQGHKVQAKLKHYEQIINAI